MRRTTDTTLDEAFDADYLYFYEPVQTPERCERETDSILRTLELEAGSRFLDAPCGYGRISNRAAARGLQVVGIDRSELLLRRAAADAARLEPDRRPVYVAGDLRTMAFNREFDGAACWFSSFGFHTPSEDDETLANFQRSLRPGGRLVLEALRREALLETLSGDRSLPVIVSEIGSDVILDRIRLADDGWGIDVDRVVCRGSAIRRLRLASRADTLASLTASLEQAGFANVRELKFEGREVDLVTKWALVVVATRA